MEPTETETPVAENTGSDAPETAPTAPAAPVPTTGRIVHWVEQYGHGKQTMAALVISSIGTDINLLVFDPHGNTFVRENAKPLVDAAGVEQESGWTWPPKV